MNRDIWRDEFANWLEGFPWQWFCTLTFRPGLSASQARWRLHAWMDDLREALGTSVFQWVGVPEHGRTGFDFHFHVLIAGLSGWQAPDRVDWMQRWNKIAGDARIDIYKQNVGGVRYILKLVAPNDLDGVEIHLDASTQLQVIFGGG